MGEAEGARDAIDLDDEAVERALLEVAEAIEGRAESVAEEMVAHQQGLPAYRDPPPELAREMHEHSLGAIHAGIRMLREGAPRLPEELRAVFVALGRQRAEEGFPLHAVVQSFQIGVRVLFEHVLRETLPRGAAAGPLLARALRLAFDVVTNSVALISESYTETRRGIEDRRQQVTGDLLADLVLSGDRLPASKATAAGIRLAPAYLVAAVPAHVPGGDPLDAGARRRMTASLELLRVTRYPGSAWGFLRDALAVILPLDAPEAGGRRTVDGMVADLEGALADRFPHGEPLVGVGRVHPELAGIRAGFEEALVACDVGRRLGRTGRVDYDEVLVHGLVASAPDLAGDLGAVLAPVAAYDAERGGGLVETLRAYLDRGLRADPTAEALGVHRNTVRARLGRIEELTGLRVAEHRLRLELALVAHDIRGEMGD